MQMTIDLTDKQTEQFQQLAKSLSISPQELVRAAIDDFLCVNQKILVKLLAMYWKKTKNYING